MKAATQHGMSDDVLRVMAAFGVNHICSALNSRAMDENWSVEGLPRLRERVESHGIRLEMVPLPLSWSYIQACPTKSGRTTRALKVAGGRIGHLNFTNCNRTRVWRRCALRRPCRPPERRRLKVRPPLPCSISASCRLQGLKPSPRRRFSARLKPCPDTNQTRPGATEAVLSASGRRNGEPAAK